MSTASLSVERKKEFPGVGLMSSTSGAHTSVFFSRIPGKARLWLPQGVHQPTAFSCMVHLNNVVVRCERRVGLRNSFPNNSPRNKINCLSFVCMQTAGCTILKEIIK
jgi:hypothetical protein